METLELITTSFWQTAVLFSFLAMVFGMASYFKAKAIQKFFPLACVSAICFIISTLMFGYIVFLKLN